MAAAEVQFDIHPDSDDFAQLDELYNLLRSSGPDTRPVKLQIRDTAIDLPDALRHLLAEVVPMLVQQKSIWVLANDDELSTQQTAAILNVSRQHVVDLIDAGKLPAHKVGTHRRVLARDLLEYRKKQREDQDAALDELARLSFDEGMYDKRSESL